MSLAVVDTDLGASMTSVIPNFAGGAAEAAACACDDVEADAFAVRVAPPACMGGWLCVRECVCACEDEDDDVTGAGAGAGAGTGAGTGRGEVSDF